MRTSSSLSRIVSKKNFRCSLTRTMFSLVVTGKMYVGNLRLKFLSTIIPHNDSEHNSDTAIKKIQIDSWNGFTEPSPVFTFCYS